MITKKTLLAISVGALLGVTGCSDDDTYVDTTAELRILKTTDLHSYLKDWNYYTDAEDQTVGFVRTATLIKEQRAVKGETNTLLVDNGDLLQGNPMADQFQQADPTAEGLNPAYAALNLLGYDAATFGNHEFNFGLDFLKGSLDGSNFPYVNANILCASETQCWNNAKPGENFFTPYIIKTQTITDVNGEKFDIKVGYIGFVPPQIMSWDKNNLEGIVTVDDIVESAKKFVPEMKAAGAEVIIALAHTGIGDAEPEPNSENMGFALSKVDGIDAMMLGHSHSIYPDAKYDGQEGFDTANGLINGVPTVMAGSWGSLLGIVDLQLERKDGVWSVISGKGSTMPIYDSVNKLPLVDADPEVAAAIEANHLDTNTFMSAPIGKSTADMYSFLSLVQDDPTVQIVADAQIHYVKKNIPSEYADLPILSASAPFKSGGRHSAPADANNFVMVAQGDLAYRSVADLYLYPNTVVAVKLNGAELKEWLECSAGQFNKIDPTISTPQYLINWESYRTYNFDVIDGVNYKIDVTKPAKLTADCKAIAGNENVSRIVDLSFTDDDGVTHTGTDLDKMEFVVASNNYRANGGLFAGTGPDHVIFEAPDSNQKALELYIKEESGFDPATGTSSAAVDPTPDNNWDFKTIAGAVPLDIRFETQNSATADEFISSQQRRVLTKLPDVDSLGFAVYKIDLQN